MLGTVSSLFQVSCGVLYCNNHLLLRMLWRGAYKESRCMLGSGELTYLEVPCELCICSYHLLLWLLPCFQRTSLCPVQLQFIPFSIYSVIENVQQRWASTHANWSNALRRLKTLSLIGRSNRSSFFKNRKFRSRPLPQCLKRFTVVFKSSIFTPLNFFRTIAHSTTILGHRLLNFSTVNLRFFTYVVSKCEEFYTHYPHVI